MFSPEELLDEESLPEELDKTLEDETVVEDEELDACDAIVTLTS